MLNFLKGLKADELLITESVRRRWNDTVHLSLPSEMKLDKSNCKFSYKLASGCRGSVSPVGLFQRDCKSWQTSNISSLI